MKVKKSQAERVHDILKQGKTVTSFDGRIDGREAFGILDMPKRCSELRQKYGADYIADEWKEVRDRYGNKTRVKVYKLNPKRPQSEQTELFEKPKRKCTAWD